MQHIQQDQCMCTDLYGMPHLGPQRMEDTKQIIDISPSLAGTKCSDLRVALVKPQPHANLPLSRPLLMQVLALSSSRPCNGSMTITWFIIIAMTPRETTPSLLNASLWIP